MQKQESKYRNFFYFIIITSEEANKSFDILYSIKDEFGLMLSIIIYIDDKTMFINETPLIDKQYLQIFIAYNTNEIVNYIKSQDYLHYGNNFKNISKQLTEEVLCYLTILNKMKFPNISQIEDKDDILFCEDGWELIDTIPKEIFNKKFIDKMYGVALGDNIRLSIFELYKKNNIESLLFEIYYKYFTFNLIPELAFNTLNIGITHFCYAYTLHEEKNSFYYLISKDLRLGNASIISKYIPIISWMNRSIEEQAIKGYEGKVFRATKIEKEFIEKKNNSK